MTHPFFFGYGSLVNTATHAYPQARPARVHGWRRVWRHTGLRDVAFLSVERAEGVAISGLIAAVPGADWADLDAREWAYRRTPLGAHEIEHDHDAASEVHLYATDRHLSDPPSRAHPILLSYIDVVVQGYLRVFGEGGAEGFFATTAGWEAPILNDRAAPRYPRAQALTHAETAFVDGHLARLASVMEELD